MRRLILLMATAVALLSFQSAFAIPALQIYIPGADWDGSTQTWVTDNSNFELWVIVANTDSKPVFDLTLVAALAQGQAPIAGALTIDGTDYDAFTYGTPPIAGSDAGDYPPHSIYPTNFIEMQIAALVDTYPQTVHNMPDYADTAPGKIFTFQVSTTYEYVHFDAFGYHNESDGLFKFVPNSHDGEYEIPEPSTLLLFGCALGLAGITRRFVKK